MLRRDPAVGLADYVRCIRAARVAWFSSVVESVLWDLAPAIRERMVARAVLSWHATTRDQYLAHLHDFVRWASLAAVDWPADGVFSWEIKLAFVDFCLSRRSGNAVAPDQLLTTPTVRNALSAISICFRQAGLPALDWPDFTKRQVLNEMSSRRKRGLEVKYRKPPVMPRLLWDVSIYLQARPRPELISSEAELRVFVACIGVYLGYIFGWRDETAARLCLSDLAFDATTGLCVFSERFCKGAFQRADQLFRRLDYHAPDAPGLAPALRVLLSPAIRDRLPDQFLSVVCTGKRLLQGALQEVLAVVARTGVVVGDLDMRPLYTAHCLRVGTTAALIKLGLGEPALKAWIGWAPSSSIWLDYARNPVFFDWELTFIRGVFRQALPA